MFPAAVRMFFALVGSFVETSHTMRCPLVWVAEVVAGVPAHRLKCGDWSRMRRLVKDAETGQGGAGKGSCTTDGIAFSDVGVCQVRDR